MRIPSRKWIPLSLAALMSGAVLAASTASGDQPSQLKIKAPPRSLPPVTVDSAVRQASAEVPSPGDEQIQREFDAYIAGLPGEATSSTNDSTMGYEMPSAPKPPRVDFAVRPTEAATAVSEDQPVAARRAVHLQQPPQTLDPAPPAAMPRSMAGETNSAANRESYAVTAEKVDAANKDAVNVDLKSYGNAGKACGSCYNNCRRFWLQADYLLWWTKGSQVPPLVTTSPQGTPRTQAGVLGQTGTAILFGDEAINNDDRSGFRLQFGYWLDRCCRVGVEAEFFDLEETTSGLDLTSPGDPILARPFFNVVTGMQDSELIAFPGVVVGRINVNSSTDLHSGGVRLRKNICCRNWCIPQCTTSCCGQSGVSGGYRVDWIAGYRYLRLDDDLGIGESLVITDPGGVLAQGTMLEVFDSFETDNEFHGGELGLTGEFRRGRWGLRALAKVALGNNHEVVRINGGTVVTVPSVASASNVGGLLAQQTNIGTFTQDEFAVLPEASLSLFYQVTCNVRATVGYNFLYLSHVLRPGDQIDFGLNPTQFPPGTLTGPARPALAFNDTDFWAQGLNFGIEVRR